MSKMKSYFAILFLFIFVKCFKENTMEVKLTIKYLYESYVGKKGTVVVQVIDEYSSFDIIDTSKTTYFTSVVTNEELNSYDINCGFFHSKNEYLHIFCNIDDNIPKGNYSINFPEEPITNYRNYNIIIYQEEILEFEKYDLDLVDLYSDNQTIIIEENKEIYELKFKITSYHQERILFYSIFMDCSQEEDELICFINKKYLEAILTTKESRYSISYISYVFYQRVFPLIPRIDIIYDVQKVDLYIGITKLIENITETNRFIAYETNITDINNLYSNLKFISINFENEDGNSYEQSCLFRKYDNSPLLLVCQINKEGINWLKEINEEKIIYDDLNVKYNFRIQPVKNQEKIKYKKEQCAYIYWVYPPVLDFTKNDSLTIEYGLANPNSLNGITFNEDVKDLTCQNIGEEVKRCIVPKSHFEGKENGYYFMKHDNHLEGKSFSYEIFPIKIILKNSPIPPDNSKGNANLFHFSFYIIVIILIMI